MRITAGDDAFGDRHRLGPRQHLRQVVAKRGIVTAAICGRFRTPKISRSVVTDLTWIRSAACTSSSRAPASNLPTQIRINCREISCRFDSACSVSPANELFRNLPLEGGAMGSMLRHGFHPPEAQQGVNSYCPICPLPGAHSIKLKRLYPHFE